MKTYRVSLNRVYDVEVKAENRHEARHLAEFFIGDCKDASEKRDREEYNFSIGEIEMTFNDAMEVTELSD